MAKYLFKPGGAVETDDPLKYAVDMAFRSGMYTIDYGDGYVQVEDQGFIEWEEVAEE